ncbi:phosphoglycerate kinase [candidate division WOR-1 bacterium RIFOXYD2_FULL_36_8]|uniref:Phosphoglycerate kinase n=1 Tax=candidate division WOR-1 bacterium RIFOXYB2_FULL_36_35 TaxID=1802578 RepID=A0A1F4S6C0_UNCSA|nr:MAG: phosphoglycerate kinase [candidate division WOR-1 bacterium RIFOXYA2_FULL_36_21]OGC14350.1 MAG: phosphoglycerate kinase [candidate division WOR-1 bacterium RIFOXYA12_FULL_36_13]OGC15974.1 MAG: phosphoglycerate kinase [candidate division WOR-1 bacterium RIFOXYB2_FULL_36_35]OGC38591.1 MAG: phosphoglycerate kinase [candidate division WOR-1 bacterium RIFOXYD2_FULL_36_8]
MAKQTVEDIKDLKGKRVLVRVDFNVPQDDKLNITDDTRIKAAIPTIKYLSDKGAKVILVSHLGRPKNGPEDKFRMEPVAKRLSELFGKQVQYVKDSIGTEVEKAVASLKEGDVLLLENVRFYKEEEKNDPEFAKKLASLAEVYVDDAFGTAHRAHASTEGVTKYLKGYAGFLMEKEIKFLGKLINNPDHPFVAILGGAKISGKIDVIKNLLPRVDTLIVGGGMSYTFFKARNVSVGNSLVEEDKIPVAKEVLKTAIDLNKTVMLPIDHIVADKFDPNANTQLVTRGGIPDGWQGMDIGPDTITKFSHAIKKAKTIFWNGPMGVFEFDKFEHGTFAIAEMIAEATEKGAISVIGGGDSVAAIEKAGLAGKISHISTGGGASLEFVEGKVLPGIACLQDK